MPSEQSLAKLEAEGVSRYVSLAIVPEFVDYWLGEETERPNWETTFRNRVRFLKEKDRLPEPSEKPKPGRTVLMPKSKPDIGHANGSAQPTLDEALEKLKAAATPHYPEGTP